MANYKVHLSVGVLLGIIGCVLSLFILFSGQYLLSFLIILFISTGSIMPDLDSDDSVPFKIVFWVFSILGGLAIFVFLKENNYFGVVKNTTIAFIFLFFIRFGVGWFFMKITHHRGMFHSIPVGLIFGLVCFHFLNSLGSEAKQSLILSFALFLGYISHLILDEIYSGINFKGIFFIPKKSLGSALKFFSGSQWANTITYAVLVVLVVSLWPKINPEVFRELFFK